MQEWAESQTHVVITWRLTGGLEEPLGVQQSGAPLRDELANCDAVWTSPSTLQLEAMLAGLPVALLDPFARPLYVPAAWYVRNAKDCGEVWESMRRGDSPRWEYQQEILGDHVDLRGPAAPKVALAGKALMEAARAGSSFFETPEEGWPAGPGSERDRLMAEMQALRRVANRGLGQTLYRLFTTIEQRLVRKR